MPSEGVDWNALPEPVRARAVELAAGAVGAMPPEQLPPSIRPVARFVAAKRAKVAGQTLLDVMRDNRAFRAAVAQWAIEKGAIESEAARPNEAARPEEAAGAEAAGEEAAGEEDPVAAATASLLLNTKDAADRIAKIATRSAEQDRRSDLSEAKSEIARLKKALKAAQAEAAEAKAEIERAKTDREQEIDKLKERLRTRGVELKQAREAAKTADQRLVIMENDATGEVAALRAQLTAQTRRADEANAQAERARAQADRARRTAREARAADEVRLGLLLNTLEGAVEGLRVELGSPATTRTPADTVGGVQRGTSTPPAVPDADALDRLIALPQAHLIVDGYNVTKTAYPHLVLAEQRERLVRQLAAVAARTRAEVTVVFDGAGVVVGKQAQIRGVRVLFSEPDVTADDVIKSLVAAEPSGRPLIVVSSDREIVTAVRANGAYPVASAVALERFDRG